MARIRISTTVDADLLTDARRLRSDSTDSKLIDAALAALSREYPVHPETGVRTTPDPEDDRILIWEILPTCHKKVVWHFSGWHWNAEEFGLDHGTLPGDAHCLYFLACNED